TGEDYLQKLRCRGVIPELDDRPGSAVRLCAELQHLLHPIPLVQPFDDEHLFPQLVELFRGCAVSSSGGRQPGDASDLQRTISPLRNTMRVILFEEGGEEMRAAFHREEGSEPEARVEAGRKDRAIDLGEKRSLARPGDRLRMLRFSHGGEEPYQARLCGHQDLPRFVTYRRQFVERRGRTSQSVRYLAQTFHRTGVQLNGEMSLGAQEPC